MLKKQRKIKVIKEVLR